MNVPSKVILIPVAAITGLFAIAAFGYGAFGMIIALSSRGGGFVGEEGFYAGALFFVSLFMLSVSLVSGIISYLCLVRLNHIRPHRR